MKHFTRHSLFYTVAFLSGLSLTGMLALRSNSYPVQPNSTQAILAQQTTAQSRSNWKSYSSSTYRINLRYPKNWNKVTTDGSSRIDGYEGSNGFFKVSAMGGTDSLQAACQSTAKHRLNPYGSKPKVQNLQVQRQPACLILPSADQLPDLKDMAALIVRYPQPVRINDHSYRFFVLWADKDYIRDMATTLRFVPRGKN